MNAATERLDPPNSLPHIVLPAGQQPVSQGAGANGSIHAVYRNGISLIDEPGAMAGFAAIAGIGGGHWLDGWVGNPSSFGVLIGSSF